MPRATMASGPDLPPAATASDGTYCWSEGPPHRLQRRRLSDVPLPPPARSPTPSLPYPISRFGYCRNLISSIVDFRTDHWHCSFKGHEFAAGKVNLRKGESQRTPKHRGGRTKRLRLGSAPLDTTPCTSRVSALEQSIHKFAEETMKSVIKPELGLSFDCLGACTCPVAIPSCSSTHQR